MNVMKAVVIGESSGRSMDEIMAVYPRHKIVVAEEGFEPDPGL